MDNIKEAITKESEKMNNPLWIKIAEILKNDIHYSGQLGTYVIHGAIEKLYNLIQNNSESEPIYKWVKAKPKIVCYCGSLHVAIDAFKKAEYEAVLSGEIALLPCCMFVDIQRKYGADSDYKIKADELHKRKIDLSDEVFILNVGGYIGESTRSEIEYAEKTGKPINYLEPINK